MLARGRALSRLRKSACVPLLIVSLCLLYVFVTGNLDKILVGPKRQLAAVEVGGEHFRVIQFWRVDSYATQLEHMTADGTTTRHEMDGDDIRRSSCQVRNVEEERKLLVTIAPNLFWEYFWETKRLYRQGRRDVWM